MRVESGELKDKDKDKCKDKDKDKDKCRVFNSQLSILNSQLFLNGRITIRDTIEGDVAFVVRRLAPECLIDMENIINSGADVFEFTELVYSLSDVCLTVEFDGVPVLICGIIQAYPDRLDVGFFFMIFTDRLREHAIIVARHFKGVFMDLIKNCKYPLVISAIHIDNRQSFKLAASLNGVFDWPRSGDKYLTVEWVKRA